MKFYLAHPLKCRGEVRAAELSFEARNPDIELINPFYDHEHKAAEQADAASSKAWKEGLDFQYIVKKDLGSIVVSDGVVAWVEKTVHTIGTYMEIWYAMTIGKPVYIITPDWPKHPWLMYVADQSKGGIFGSFEEFEKFIRNKP